MRVDRVLCMCAGTLAARCAIPSNALTSTLLLPLGLSCPVHSLLALFTYPTPTNTLTICPLFSLHPSLLTTILIPGLHHTVHLDSQCRVVVGRNRFLRKYPSALPVLWSGSGLDDNQ